VFACARRDDEISYNEALVDEALCFHAVRLSVCACVRSQVSDDTMKSRIMRRATTSHRSDDNEQTVMRRLATFHDFNQPVVDYYQKLGKLCTVLDRFFDAQLLPSGTH